MYKIAIYLTFLENVSPVDGSISPAPKSFESSIKMYDANDTQINFKHIIPLLPVELVDSIKKYYNNYIGTYSEKEKQKTSDSLIASLIEHNFF